MVVGEISASHSGASHAALFLLSPLLSLLPRNITLPSVFHFFLHISLVNSTNFFFSFWITFYFLHTSDFLLSLACCMRAWLMIHSKTTTNGLYMLYSYILKYLVLEIIEQGSYLGWGSCVVPIASLPGSTRNSRNAHRDNKSWYREDSVCNSLVGHLRLTLVRRRLVCEHHDYLLSRPRKFLPAPVFWNLTSQ